MKNIIFYNTCIEYLIKNLYSDVCVFFYTVPPTIWMENQLVGAQIDQSITLECISEAFPKSIDYWTRNKTIIITNGK